MKLKKIPELVKIRQDIMKKLEEYDILPFILDEIEDSLDYMNKYKLQNIIKNIESLAKKLENLNKSYKNSLYT